ncbi:MAG: peptide chain release factor N(5)-glutamine methyltransferase [Saprospiraceae bacterium]
MYTTSSATAFEQLAQSLTPRYGLGEALSIARIVLEDAFGEKKPSGRLLSSEENDRFGQIKQRLISGEPVQYVLGEADFFGLKFCVNPAVLIPRQETEELVAWVLEYLRACGIASPVVLDIGLGSGCIALALKRKRKEIQLFGLEKSAAALAVAEENARRLVGETSTQFFLADIFDPVTATFFPPLDVIVSNPPYIPAHERSRVPEHVQAHEPEEALFVEGDDPLLFYRAIARFAQQKLQPGGRLFFECNEFNAAAVAPLLQEMGFTQIELRKDLSGADRMVGAAWG